MQHYTSAYPFKRVVGGEHAPSFVDVLRANLRNLAGRMNCLDTEVVAGDTLGYLPPENENLLVDMFNPFSALFVARCVDRLAAAHLAAGK
jgi:hypothetical protein